MWTKEREEREETRRGASDIENAYGTFHEPEKTSKPSRLSLIGHDAHRVGQNWMSLLDDDMPLSSLTVPGTHDSAAFTKSWPFVATQTMTILDQLNAGIRYFDLRCGIRDDVMEMVHGPTYLGITLQHVLGTMYMWLEAHSTEALVVQIKRDRMNSRSTVHFSQGIFNLISNKMERWRTSNTTPSLGALRGRIQLFRRFEAPDAQALGINVTKWMDNPIRPFTISTESGVQITIQDHYSFVGPEPLPSLIVKKGMDVSGLLERASADSDQNCWYINFTSAYELNIYYQVPPREVAVGGWWGFKWEDGINVRLRTYLTGKRGRRRRFGVVAMDFPDIGTNGLIDALVESNLEPESDSMWQRLVAWLTAIVLVIIIMRIIQDTAIWSQFDQGLQAAKDSPYPI